MTMPEADKNLTPGQEGDAVAAYLSAARERWEAAGSGTWQDYATALELLSSALRSVADVPRLLGAVEAALALHQSREITETTVCTAHASGSMWRRSETLPEFRAETKACPDCIEVRKLICAHCACPNDEWPCPTYRDITAELLGREGTDDARN